MKHWLVVLVLAGCQAADTGPYAPASGAARRTSEAEQLSRKAAVLIQDEPEAAEQLLREALTADLFFGPAHNNLGVLYLQQGKLYEAASELEWARKLMPGHPDPRLNLALTLERAGQVDEAIATYRTALEVYPGHIGSTQGLVRLCVAEGREPEDLRSLLEEVALRGESERWRAWARDRLDGWRRAPIR